MDKNKEPTQSAAKSSIKLPPKAIAPPIADTEHSIGSVIANKLNYLANNGYIKPDDKEKLTDEVKRFVDGREPHIPELLALNAACKQIKEGSWLPPKAATAKYSPKEGVQEIKNTVPSVAETEALFAAQAWGEPTPVNPEIEAISHASHYARLEEYRAMSHKGETKDE
jgi:hypothetical protein